MKRDIWNHEKNITPSQRLISQITQLVTLLQVVMNIFTLRTLLYELTLSLFPNNFKNKIIRRRTIGKSVNKYTINNTNKQLLE